MRNDIERVFFTANEIEAKVAALGEQISKDFEGKDPLFVGVLKGCFVFMAAYAPCKYPVLYGFHGRLVL